MPSFGKAEQDLASDAQAVNYGRPHPLDFITKVPSDIKKFTKDTFSRKSLAPIAIIAASTGLLLLVDQKLVDGSHKMGDNLHITHTNYQRTVISLPLGKSKVGIEGPFDSGSALYFIGDGTVDVMLAAGLLSYGVAKSDNRAMQTSSQIVESILAGGAIAQLIKHASGRGSPFTTEESGGDWRTFPKPKTYQAHVASYDAFPSGHLTASFATLTVLAENYPEYHWIRPVGYTLFGALGFQMMNNGVHWASDYPLAIGLGYAFGKIVSRRGRETSGQQADVHFIPYAGNGTWGAQVLCRFSGPETKKGHHA